MATKQLYIDNPCSESWDDMNPEGNGRHCMKCCKTVVDFSDWKTEDIINYIRLSSQNICGQVKATEVATAAPTLPLYRNLLQKIMLTPASLIRKAAAIIILCFGFNGRQDLFAQQPQQQSPQKKEPGRPVIMGGISIPPKRDTTGKNNKTPGDGTTAPVPRDSIKVCPPEKNIRGEIRVDQGRK